MKRFFLIVLSILFFQNLPAQSGYRSKVISLNLSEAFSRRQETGVSKFVDKIIYIPLETNPEVLISDGARFEVTNEFVIVRQRGANQKYQILLFERETGRFIREIGNQGRGPGEYYIYSFLPFNSIRKELYAISATGELLAYDLSGNNTDRIKIPEWTDPEIPKATNTNSTIDNQRILITADDMLDGNTFVGYVINNSGWEKRKMALFSKAGVLKVFPNYRTYKRDNPNGFSVPPIGGFAKFYKWDNKLNFIEAFCDTLYQVTRDLLAPRYFFNWGKSNAPYSRQIEIKSDDHYWDYFYITDIDENKNFIFVQLIFEQKGYTAFVDKRTDIVTFCKTGISGISALKDDISGLMDIIPQEFTEKNEMVFIIQPQKLINWLKENPGKATKARNSLPWLKNIDEFSNPVIAIGKCED